MPTASLADRGSRSGSFDRLITILVPGEGVDDGYTSQPGFTPIENVPARMEPTPGYVKWRAGEQIGDAPVVFAIRWEPDVANLSTSIKVEFEGRTLQVVAVTEVGRESEIHISTIERTDQAALPDPAP